MVPPGETEHKEQIEDVEEHKVGVDIPPAEPAPQLPGIRGVQEEEEPTGRHQGNAAHRPLIKLYGAVRHICVVNHIRNSKSIQSNRWNIEL